METVSHEAIKPANFTLPFWEATRECKLLLQFCPRTRQYQFYPRPLSLFTARRDLEWRESPGLGTLFSFTVSRIGTGRMAGQEPYLVGMVELDEGVRIIGGLVGLTPENCRIGRRMEPSWLPINGGFHLLQFRPAEQIND